MKKIKLLILSFIFCFIAVFSGCSLAVLEGDGGNGGNGNGGDNGNNLPDVKTEFEDSYAGVMVIVADENYALINSENMGDENCVAFAYRYEANVFDYDWAYKGVVYQDESGYDYFADCHLFSEIIDNKEEARAELTVYCNAARAEEWKFGICTLSYDGNGEIDKGGYTYHSNLSNGSFGTDFYVTQTITEEKTWNGVTENSEKSMTLRVKLTVEARDVGTDWKILQYRGDGSLIKAAAVDVAQEGDFILEDDCAFVVTEETFTDGVKRTLYEKDEKGFPDAEFFYDGGFGLLKSATFSLAYANIVE